MLQTCLHCKRWCLEPSGACNQLRLTRWVAWEVCRDGDSAACSTTCSIVPRGSCCCLGPRIALDQPAKMDKRRVCVAVDASNTSRSALEWVGRSQLGQKMDEASRGRVATLLCCSPSAARHLPPLLRDDLS